MLIKMLIGQEGPTVSRLPGGEYDIDDAEAVRLIEASYAIPVSDKKVETTSVKTVTETRQEPDDVASDDDGGADKPAGRTRRGKASA